MEKEMLKEEKMPNYTQKTKEGGIENRRMD